MKVSDKILLIDGWSNLHNKSITASCVQINEKKYITVDTKNRGATKKTEEFLLKKCIYTT